MKIATAQLGTLVTHSGLFMDKTFDQRNFGDKVKTLVFCKQQIAIDRCDMMPLIQRIKEDYTLLILIEFLLKAYVIHYPLTHQPLTHPPS